MRQPLPDQFPKLVGCNGPNNRKRVNWNHGKSIADTIEVIHEWRKVYDGFLDPETRKFREMTREEAANKLGLRVAGLNKYYSLIR